MKVILLAIMIGLGSITAAAQDVILLKINNKLIGKMTARPSTPLVVEAQRSKYKNIHSISLEYPEAQSTNPYKRTIEITNKDEGQIYAIEQVKEKPWIYTIATPATIRILQKQKIIKVFVILNPANDKMGMPSRRNLLVEVHLH